MNTGGTVVKRAKYADQKRNYHHAAKLQVQEDDATLYARPISIYDTIPDINLAVAEFEKFALARLKALRIIERTNLTFAEKFSTDWRNKIFEEMKKQEDVVEFVTLLFTSTRDDHESVIKCRQFDHISHFLLRLAFAGTEEQRKWFISLEVDMFHLKLVELSAADLKRFLETEDFPGELIMEKEKQKYQVQICNALGPLEGGLAVQKNNLLNSDIYKIPFDMALDLVKNRKVFLRKGKVYVPYNEIVSVICSAYRSHLSESLSLVTKNMHIVQQDGRIMQAIADFDRRHTGNDYANKKSDDSVVTAEELPTLSQKSFPLCMKTLYDVVVKDHHLKHFGRLQFGLFLKAIGVPLDQATKFWRGHFTKKPEIDGSRFDKQYLYNIRHMYGQEGRRADYTPYSCMKVITSNVGPGDFHGCPFKHSDQGNLRAKLTEAKVPPNGIKEIMDLVEKHHYQIACQKYFEWTHDSMTVDGGVNHPNQYFEESREVLSGKKTIKVEDKLKTKHVVIMPKKELSADAETQLINETDNSEFPTDMELEDDSLVYMASQDY